MNKTNNKDSALAGAAAPIETKPTPTAMAGALRDSPADPGPHVDARVLHSVLHPGKPFPDWWDRLVEDLKLEQGLDYLSAPDGGDEGLEARLLLTEEAATEALLTADGNAGRLVSQFFHEVTRVPIPLEMAMEILRGPDQTEDDDAIGLHDQGASPRIGRGFFRAPGTGKFVVAAESPEMLRSLSWTAVRCQLVVRYFAGYPITYCKLVRNCDGLVGDQDGLVTLSALARYLGISGVARWFRKEVESLDLRLGIDYHTTRPNAVRSIKLTESTAFQLILRAPTLPGRWMRIYCLALAHVRWPEGILRKLAIV